MRNRILFLVLVPMTAGVCMANAKHLCAPTLIGTDDVQFIYNQSDDPASHLPAGLTTTEDQTVACGSNDTSPCVVGLQVLVRQADPPQPPLLPILLETDCKNCQINCGAEMDIVLEKSWGTLPGGNYEYISYWQYYGCDPNAPVNVTSTTEFSVP